MSASSTSAVSGARALSGLLDLLPSSLASGYGARLLRARVRLAMVSPETPCLLRAAARP
ncbi:hypothetical protein PR002_g30732 [Phytophthora rubi]|uniref:Uncharacterized protein n=1 Tax=Phytophthora rubi TaxID=129364 RepID=A0A6A3GMX6_9STRA|nr:hypothetical protein PR002_g30732 [Phytophthora rubi]